MKLAAISSLVLQASLLLAQTGGEAVVLEDVRLIDGTGTAPFDHASILIENGKIARVSIGSHPAWPASARVLRLSGKTVIPGLINGHGHLGLTQGTSVSPANYTLANVKRQLAQYERYGVTTMISLGMNRDLLYQLRAQQREGKFGGTMILTADRGIGVRGGVPAVNAATDQLYRPATPEEARADVREMAARHADLVKIWVDDNLHKLPRPDPAVYGAAIEEAHRHGLRVAAHVYYLADAKRLLADHVDILAHSIRDQEIDPETIAVIKAQAVYYIPTLQLEESFFIYADHPSWMQSPFFRRALNPPLANLLNSVAYKQKIGQDPATATHRKALEIAMKNVRKLHDAGALVAFGTDSGANPFRIQGFAEHRELQLMVEAGMTPLEAIHSATAVDANMLHIGDQTGTVQVGKRADLLVLDGDPSGDIKKTEKIAMVFEKGVGLTK